jgi:hypothetical protein
MNLPFRRRVDVPELTAVTVPVYAPDARGAALFHGIANQTAPNRVTTALRIDARGGSWGGWTQAPQVVRSVGLGRGRPVVERGGTIDDERGLTSPVQEIFTQRMAARRL